VQVHFGMEEPSHWDSSRYTILICVLALHFALVALLAWTSRTGIPTHAMERSVELVYLPPVSLPRVRSQNALPRRLGGVTAVAATLPDLNSSLPSTQSSSTGSTGSGSGVDWAAEARRALQAFEIRNHRPARNTSVSGSPAEENWWPRARHYAGEQYKTANGDWIVWINESCYQIAVSGPSIYAPAATPPQTICPGSANTAR
jgi:hypothetical protein